MCLYGQFFVADRKIISVVFFKCVKLKASSIQGGMQPFAGTSCSAGYAFTPAAGGGVLRS